MRRAQRSGLMGVTWLTGPFHRCTQVSAARPERRFVIYRTALFPTAVGCLVAGTGHLRTLARRLLGGVKAALEPAGLPPTVSDQKSPTNPPQAKAGAGFPLPPP